MNNLTVIANNTFHELSLSYAAATSRVSVVEGKAARLHSLRMRWRTCA